MSRTAQLALLFKDMAMLRLGRKSRREQRARQISERLGLMHGLPQKIGQLLSFSELDSNQDVFTTLTENVASMPLAEATAELDRQLATLNQPGWRETFLEFAAEGVSASIGQVHRAKTTAGRDVAVKIQYPGIADALQFDLRSLGWLTAPVGDLRKGFDMAAYRTEIGDMLESELDFGREAESTRRFGSLVADEPPLVDHVETPKVIAEFSNQRLLTTTWLSGSRFAEITSWPEADRQTIANTLLRLFLRGCFTWGTIHADPHPGNYRFRRVDGTPRVGLLDFGCVKELPVDLTAGLFQLLSDSPDEEQAIELHHCMGFNPTLLRPLHGRLSQLSQILFAPFACDSPFDLSTWHIRDVVGELLGEQRMNYRLAGPPEMIYLLRSFQGLLQYLKALDTPVNWHSILREAKPVEASVPPTVSTAVADEEDGMLSESLHILVSEHGRQKVALCFGASATANLVDLVPQDLKPKLDQRGIDLADIAYGACQSHFAPGELFHLLDGAKSVRVWLD